MHLELWDQDTGRGERHVQERKSGIIRILLPREWGKRMLKRKYGDRSDWKRVVKRQYIQTFLNTEEFKRYVTLLKVLKVTEPLTVYYHEKSVCIVDDGYVWLQHFPIEERYSLTSMFDAQGEIVQWYIDVCHKIGIENNIPWMEDLFLDIVVLPIGEVIHKDVNELEEALSKGIFDISQYKMAWEEANKITKMILNYYFNLFKLSKTHKELLLNMLHQQWGRDVSHRSTALFKHERKGTVMSAPLGIP